VLGSDFNTLCLETWWHRMLTPFLVEGNASPQEPNQSVVGVLTRLLTEIKPGTDRYDVQLDLNLAALPPHLVSLFVKGVAVGLVGLLAFFCRTKDPDRKSPLYLGEISLVVLTMLFVSERSWKHHFVTLVFPYTYLVYELYSPGLTSRVRYAIGAALATSFLFMASTSSELGGLFADGRGHDVAQYYGMFMWAAVVLYVAVAWRLRAGQAGAAAVAAPAPATPDRGAPAANHALSPAYKTLEAG
jgi:hypothetical protein